MSILDITFQNSIWIYLAIPLLGLLFFFYYQAFFLMVTVLFLVFRFSFCNDVEFSSGSTIEFESQPITKNTAKIKNIIIQKKLDDKK